MPVERLERLERRALARLELSDYNDPSINVERRFT